MAKAAGRSTFSPTLLKKVLWAEWRKFRSWADEKPRGRPAKVYPAGRGEWEGAIDNRSADPGELAEMADEIRKSWIERTLDPAERARIQKMSDKNVLAVAGECASQIADDSQLRPSGRDYRSLSRRK